MLQKLLSSLKVYADKRMLVMLAFGFSSGFPFALVYSTLGLWLKDVGISIALIASFSLLKTPYSFKWLWAPLIDRLPLPILGKLGRRRSWALLTQILIISAIISMSLCSPALKNYTIALFAFILSLSSASQDIVLDAYRVENFNTQEQGSASAVFVLGYRIGLIFSGAGALYLAEYFSWNQVYLMMSSGVLIGILTVLCIREKPFIPQNTDKSQIFSFKKAVWAPLKDFSKKAGWIYILLFILFYRLSDAYIGPMAYLFYDDMGFSYKDIAKVSNLYGSLTTIIGMLIGGAVLRRISLPKCLIYFGILQGLSNLIYVAQAYVGNNIYMLMLTISVENISGGLGTAAFMAYLASLCNVEYTATQYALLSSFMSLVRDVLASTSGLLVKAVGWTPFFVLTTLMALPGLFLLVYMLKKYPPQSKTEA